MATPLTTYTARFTSPEFIERAKAVRLQCEVQRSNAIVVPASGTVTLRDAGNVAIVDAAAVTVGTDGVAYYDLAAATIPDTMATSQAWVLEWTLTFSDGQVQTFRRDAHLCLRRLYPVVTVGDILRRHRDLHDLVNNGVDLQSYGDDAWDSIIFRFLGEGRQPQKVMTPWSFAEAHKALWLHRVFLDATLNGGDGDKYGILAEFYSKTYEAAMLALRTTYDRDEDNLPPSASEQGESAQPPLMLSAGPVGRNRYGRW